MYLELENIGGFKSAKVQIDGITVIAGNNNTGKSTIGKSLLLMFNSLHNLEHNIDKDKIGAIAKILAMLFRTKRNSIDTIGLAGYLYKNQSEFDKSERELKTLIERSVEDFYDGDYDDEINAEESSSNRNPSELFESMDEGDWEEATTQIVKTLYRSKNSYIEGFFSHCSRSLFKGIISHNEESKKKSTIHLHVKNKDIKCKFTSNEVSEVQNAKDFYVRAIYIDNPFLLDELAPFIRNFNKSDGGKQINSYDIKSLLLSSLAVAKDENISLTILKEEGLQEIFSQLQSLNIGEINKKNNTVKYRYNDKHELPISNISTGLKVFLIIKTLLLNGSLQENGTLILDEPEIHLHPEWQLIFAEIIVLLQKTFGLHIVLTTHSPYFLKAIETFAEKHEIEKKCHYYMTDCADSYCTIEDVTENTQVIYEKFYYPLTRLEEISNNA